MGKDRSGLFEPAVQEYARRLAHYVGFELVELAAQKSKAAEGQALLGKLRAQEWLVALDEHGTQLDSVELSRFVARAQQESKDLAFVIGGDEGLSPEVLARARLVLSLSRMTLPHRLARVVIAEQLYRAFAILRGEPYHK